MGLVSIVLFCLRAYEGSIGEAEIFLDLGTAFLPVPPFLSRVSLTSGVDYMHSVCSEHRQFISPLIVRKRGSRPARRDAHLPSFFALVCSLFLLIIL